MRTSILPPLSAALVFAAFACGESKGPVAKPSEATAQPAAAAAAAPDKIDLLGAGATFPNPLYSRWVSEYQKVKPNVRVNYQSIGSGGGIRQILEKTVDFGASDAPMTAEELAKAGSPLIHVPTTLGAVVVSFNLDGIPNLKLSSEALAGIFLGTVKSWNDPVIAKQNPGVKLPKLPITVIHRSDGSGTTAVFTEYLSKVSPGWKEKVGAGKSVNFPTGLGAKGNEGVAGQIKTNPGSIGYVELAYAKQTSLPTVTLKNHAGKFVEPSLEGITAAAQGVKDIPDDLRMSIVDAEGDAAYPISAFTYILVYENSDNAEKGKALAKFLWWAIHDGQSFGAPLSYAPLPPGIVTKVESKLKGLKSGGQTLLEG